MYHNAALESTRAIELDIALYSSINIHLVYLFRFFAVCVEWRCCRPLCDVRSCPIISCCCPCRDLPSHRDLTNDAVLFTKAEVRSSYVFLKSQRFFVYFLSWNKAAGHAINCTWVYRGHAIDARERRGCVPRHTCWSTRFDAVVRGYLCFHCFASRTRAVYPAAGNADGGLVKVYGDAQESPQTESYWGNVNCHGKKEPPPLSFPFFVFRDGLLDAVRLHAEVTEEVLIYLF